ncbi:MAG: formylglycine-generating enzyme family protein [Lacipirellulaceae bacterium]
MTRHLLLASLAVALAAASAAAAPVTLDWAHVGNAGNAPDSPDSFGDAYGAVAYIYAISKHEVTNAQYAVFLNAVDPSAANARSLYNRAMAGGLGGIELRPSFVDGSKFSVKSGRGQNPVNYVSFFDAMRFVNWLHNGQGAAGSASGGTETGVYTVSNGTGETRARNARFWIPNDNEWYKAAYHDSRSGTAGAYFDFATGSDAVPTSDRPSDNPAAVNYYNNDGIDNGFNGGYAVSGTTTLGPDPLTDVGAYTAARSPYGTYDQSGNVWEWTEGNTSDPLSFFRSFRGASMGNAVFDLRAASASFPIGVVGFEDAYTGFRVATVPEPAAALLASLAAISFVTRRR